MTGSALLPFSAPNQLPVAVCRVPAAVRWAGVLVAAALVLAGARDGHAAPCSPTSAKLNAKCNYSSQCQKGHHQCSATDVPADTNGDCLIDSCTACPVGTRAADANGDGCDDSCVCCPVLSCGSKTTAVDLDGDGCVEICVDSRTLARDAEKAQKAADKASRKLFKPGGCTEKKLSQGLCPDCGVGTCTDGSYCDGADCANPRCYTPDSLISLAMCGGIIDPCCGVGTCVGGSYCDGPHCGDAVCHVPSDPISLVMCGGAFQPGCGLGACDHGSYCDNCVCHAPDSAISQVFCACDNPVCGEVKKGCGVGSCVGGSYCDGCVCYAPDSNVSQTCCTPAVQTTFDQIYVPTAPGPHYHHVIAGLETSDKGFFMVGGLESGTMARTDAYGSLIWFREAATTWSDVVEVSGGFVLTGVDGRLTRIDSLGNIVWSRKMAGALYGLTVADHGELVATGELGGQLFIARVTAAGSFMWARVVGGANADEGNSIIRQGTGFLVLGNTSSFGAGSQDLWLLRFDGLGNVLWTQTFGGAGLEGSFYGIIQRQSLSPTSDGGAIIATNSNSFPLLDQTMVVLKVDALGILEWANGYSVGIASVASAAVEAVNGYRVFGSRGEELQMALAYDGTAQWTRTYGSDNYVNYLDGAVTSDGGGVLLTESHHFPVASPAHWFRVVKTDQLGRTHGCCDEQNLAAIVLSVPFPLVPTSGYSSAALTSPFLVDLLASTALPMTELTHCESRDDYLCGGIVTGECLCPY